MEQHLPLQTAYERKSRLNVESDLLFDVSTQRIEPLIDSKLDFGTTGFSYSFFMDADGINGDNYPFQIYGNGYNMYCMLGISSFSAAVLNNEEFTQKNLVYSYNLSNKKTHVVFTFDSNTYRLYINSTEVVSVNSDAPGTSNWNLSNATNFSIGNRINNTDALNGTLSHFCFFNKALTQDEISNIHIQGGLIPSSTHQYCVAHYSLNQSNYTSHLISNSLNTTLAGDGNNDFISNEILAGDGYLEYTFINSSAQAMIGLDTAAITTWSDWIYGANGGSNSRDVAFWSGSTELYRNTTTVDSVKYLIKIERIGSDINFYIDNNLMYTISNGVTVNLHVVGTWFGSRNITDVKLNGKFITLDIANSTNGNVTLNENKPILTYDNVEQYNYSKYYNSLDITNFFVTNGTTDGIGTYTSDNIVGTKLYVHYNSTESGNRLEVSLTINTAFNNNTNVILQEVTYTGLGLIATFDGTIIGTPQTFTWEYPFNNTSGRWSFLVDGVESTTGSFTLHYLKFKGDLKPSHGELINFGTSESILNTNIKDFYRKTSLLNSGFSVLKEVENNNKIYYYTDTGSTNISPSSDFTFLAVSQIVPPFNVSGAGNVLVVQSFSYGIFELSVRNTTFMRFRPGVGGGLFDVSTLTNPEMTAVDFPISHQKPFIFLVSYDSINGIVKLLYKPLHYTRSFKNIISTDDIPMGTSGSTVIGLSTALAGSPITKILLFADSYLPDSLDETVLNLDFSVISNKKFHWNFSKIQKNPLIVSDLSGNNNDGVLYNDTGIPFTSNPLNPIEFESTSLLPPLYNVLTIDNTIVLTAPSTIGNAIGTSEITSLITLKFPVDSLKLSTNRILLNLGIEHSLQVLSDSRVRFILGKESQPYDDGIVPTYYLNMFGYRDNSSTDSGVVFVNGNEQYNTPSANLISDLTGEKLVIGGIDTTVSIARVAVWNRILADEEMIEMSNNMTFNNPTIEQQDKLICYYNMNQSSFYENTANVLLKNYAQWIDPNYSVPLFSSGSWILSSEFTVSGEQMTYDGTGAGSRSVYVAISNMLDNENPEVWFSINVISNTGKFWVFVGGSSATINRIEITGIGQKVVKLQADGTAKLFFANSNGVDSDINAVWTVEYPILWAVNNDMVVSGLSGTTASEQLLDIYNYLTDIDELRVSDSLSTIEPPALPDESILINNTDALLINGTDKFLIL